MQATIDLHCHILPGIDDGARDLDDAVAMAREAHADGIAVVCATPHIRHDHDVRIAELPERLGELQAAVRAAGCPVAILPGGEVAATAIDGLEPDELTAVTLGGAGKWVLLEPAPGPLDDQIQAAVEKLHGHGLRALVAHPERHAGEDLVPRLRQLRGAGALVQATAAFLTDDAAGPAMASLARQGLIHVLGSDSHSSHAGRPVALAAALEALRAVQPTGSHLDWIARAAPEAIVAGRDLRPPY
jgi:protein-tyrosine phosphatase